MEHSEVKSTRPIYQFYDLETGIEKVLKDKTIRFSSAVNFNVPINSSEDLLTTKSMN